MNDFQKKVENEVKLTKKRIYLQEVISLFAAVIFASNLCCVVMFPFTFVTLFNVWIVYQSIKCFKPTVKTQYFLHQHLKFLASAKEQKVWTPSD